jgi:uncharacterized membrane protein
MDDREQESIMDFDNINVESILMFILLTTLLIIISTKIPFKGLIFFGILFFISTIIIPAYYEKFEEWRGKKNAERKLKCSKHRLL